MSYADLVAGLRPLADAMKPDICVIQRGTETTTGDGTSVSWANLATGVACRLQPRGASPNEAIGGSGGVQVAADWRIAVPANQDVTSKDRIAIGSRVFEVVTPLDRSYEVELVVLCTEIT